MYLKNDVYNDEKTALSIDKILNGDVNIPVMIIYGDIMLNLTNKDKNS